MKIGIDCRLHYYNRAGIGRYIQNLIRELPQCALGDEIVLLQSRREGGPIAQGPSLQCRKVVTPAHHSWERWLFGLEVAAKGIDVLHSPDHVAPRQHGWQSVVTIQDLAFLAHPEAYRADSLHYYTQVFRTLASASHVIAISDFTRDEVLNRVSIAPDKVKTIRLAADPRFGPRPDDECRRVREKLEVPETYFLVVGTIEERKNLVQLLAAYALLPRSDRPHLVFAGGSGFHADRVLEAVQAHRLEDWVRFLGFVDEADLPMLYSGARALLFPSRYEGFGLPILEAMACGCPVLASNRGSMAEVAGDAAILVDPNEAEAMAEGMRQIPERGPLRQELIAKGRARVKQFSWRTAAEQTLAIYREAAASH